MLVTVASKSSTQVHQDSSVLLLLRVLQIFKLSTVFKIPIRKLSQGFCLVDLYILDCSFPTNSGLFTGEQMESLRPHLSLPSLQQGLSTKCRAAGTKPVSKCPSRLSIAII